MEKIIAISREIPKKNIIKVAEALYRGGISFMEVTFNPSDNSSSNNTLECIRVLKSEFGNEMHFGAGTVLTTEHVEAAFEVGAEYIISPNVDNNVIRKTKELGMLSIPGAMTPTEALYAYNCGADYIKLFPAGNLGAAYIKAMLASINHLKLIAVGGIDETNILGLLNSGCVGVGIGGSIINRQLVETENYQEISERALNFVELIKNAG